MVTCVSTTFTLTITPLYNSQSLYSLDINASCRGSTHHTFTEPGTHRIEICLNGIDIYGSPRFVEVYPAPNSDIPIPLWRLLNYTIDRHTNNLIEALYQSGCVRTPEIGLPSTGYNWALDFNAGKATRENFFRWTVEEPLSRDIWFWTDDQLKLVPYSPEYAQALENGFINGTQDRVDVNDLVRNKTRWVMKGPGEGEYRQYRQKRDAKKEGRRVYRGYYGQSLDLNPVSLLWQYKRILLRAFLNLIPNQVILKIFKFSKQSELDQYALIARDMKRIIDRQNNALLYNFDT
jgi:hypothetical protein